MTKRHGLLCAMACGMFLGLAGMGNAQKPDTNAYLEFIRSAAQRDVAAGGAKLDDLAAANRRLAVVRKKLLESWGGFPETPCDLAPRKLDELDRDGYKLEKLVIQTFPGVWMTAHAYVPKKEGKLPAVLCVHGHWKEAKQSPQVQARCIGLAKHGFFVLAVDAFGAGERGVGEALGEYHGEMTAGTLFPIGKPLSGIQVYENMRAVDYLQSRPEVDPDKLGITGASGGGNQTMYAGAWDTRFKAVVPVCSVGTYNAYLGAACCMCEVVPGAASFCCEGEILGLCAPRGLMLFNATQDANQFSVKEARKSLAVAQTFFDLNDAPAALQQTVFDWKHDYSQTMRERMYGWMTLKLKGEGDGSPLSDPVMKVEDPESIRCYPGDSRPDDWLTLPQFAAAEGRRLVQGIETPDDATAWESQQVRLRTALLRSSVFRNNPRPSDGPTNSVTLTTTDAPQTAVVSIESEPGVTLTCQMTPVKQSVTSPANVVIIANLDAENADQVKRISEAASQQGWAVLIPQLRATGEQSIAGDKIGHAPDHNSGQWGVWVDRPLLGQWAHDLQRVVTATRGAASGEIAVVGVGSAGPVVLCAAAVDSRITRVATVNSLSSYISDVPYRGQRFGVLAPGILRDVGDIEHIASLVAPRPLTIAGGVTGGGVALDDEGLKSAYDFTQQVYGLAAKEPVLTIRTGEFDVAEFLKAR
ncbi:MAG: acetylxylan esterase [Planctomycetaceae bacterium]